MTKRKSVSMKNERRKMKDGKSVAYRPFFIFLFSSFIFWLSIAGEIQAAVDVTTRLIPYAADDLDGIIYVGDEMVLSVQVEHPPGGEVILPESLGLGEALDIRDVKVTPDPDTPGLTRVAIRFAPFETGQITLPSFTLGYLEAGEAGELFVSDTTFEVEPVLSESEDMPADIKPQSELPYEIPWKLWGVIAAAVAVLGFLAWKLWQWRKRSVAGTLEGESPSRPPYDEAVADLEKLLAQKLLERGAHKDHYDRLSFILRRYLERRYGLPVLESTTSEALVLMRSDRGLKKFRDLIKPLLERADLVKFARHKPLSEEGDADWQDVRNFVEKTKPAPVSEEEKSEAEAEAA